MKNFKLVAVTLNKMFPKRKDRASFLGVDANDYASKVNTVKNKIEWLKSFLKPLNLFLKISEHEKDLKIFAIEFNPKYPGPCGLVVAAKSRLEASNIARKIVTHTDELTVKEVDISVPCIIFYESGEY